MPDLSFDRADNPVKERARLKTTEWLNAWNRKSLKKDWKSLDPPSETKLKPKRSDIIRMWSNGQNV